MIHPGISRLDCEGEVLAGFSVCRSDPIYFLSFVSLFPITYDATLLFYEDLKPVHLPLHRLGTASNASGQRPPFCIRDLQCLEWKPLSGEDEDDQSSRSWLHDSARGGKSEETKRENAVEGLE